MPRALRVLGRAAVPLAFFALVLALWETASSLGWWDRRLLPGAWAVGRALVGGVSDGGLAAACRTSLLRLAIAFVAALAFGGLLGLVTGAAALLQRTIGVLALGLQTLPSVCWVPLALVWFGVGERAIFFVTFVGAVLAVTIAVADGIRHTPTEYVRAARMMGARGPRLYWEVMVPAALPAVIAGAKQGWAFAWRSLMAGELLSASGGAVGLGQMLTQARNAHNMPMVMALMLILIGVGVLADRAAFSPLERRVRRQWGLEAG